MVLDGFTGAGNVFKKLKHRFIIIGCWDIHRSVHLLFKHAHSIESISICELIDSIKIGINI